MPRRTRRVKNTAISKSETLISLVNQLNTHEVSNAEGYEDISGENFLRSTDRKTVDLIDDIDAEARSLLGSGNGSIDKRALTNIKKAGIDARQAGPPYDPDDVSVVIKTKHGDVVVSL